MKSLPKLRYFLRPISSGNAIKNTAEVETGDGLYPAYSASGQDVWVKNYDYEGDAIILSAVGARSGKTFAATGKWATVANTQAFVLERGADLRFFW